MKKWWFGNNCDVKRCRVCDDHGVSAHIYLFKNYHREGISHEKISLKQENFRARTSDKSVLLARDRDIIIIGTLMFESAPQANHYFGENPNCSYKRFSSSCWMLIHLNTEKCFLFPLLYLLCKFSTYSSSISISKSRSVFFLAFTSSSASIATGVSPSNGSQSCPLAAAARRARTFAGMQGGRAWKSMRSCCYYLYTHRAVKSQH